MTAESKEIGLELQRVLWACYKYWQGSDSLPPHERVICYSWVLRVYEDTFGTRFHQSKLGQLAKAGFLKKGDLAKGGSRRYYRLVDPDSVSALLGQLDLQGVGQT